VLRETLVLFDDSGAPQTTTEVAERLDLGRRSTYERLTRLVDHDQIETKKVGANGRVWWRSTTTNTAGQSASAQDRSATGESDIDDTPVRKQFERGGDDRRTFELLVDAVKEYAIFSLLPTGTFEPGIAVLSASRATIQRRFWASTSRRSIPRTIAQPTPEQNLSESSEPGLSNG